MVVVVVFAVRPRNRRTLSEVMRLLLMLFREDKLIKSLHDVFCVLVDEVVHGSKPKVIVAMKVLYVLACCFDLVL